jgi:dTDP-4-amino-4,6-dideoxygalactose transaminase
MLHQKETDHIGAYPSIRAVQTTGSTAGIGPRRYFDPSLNDLPFLKPDLKRDCPLSESIASRVLCLPLYEGLLRSEIDFICGHIRRTLQSDAKL